MALAAMFDIGDRVRVGNHAGGDRAPFADVAGTPTTPDTVRLTLRRADGTTLVYGWPDATGLTGLLLTEEANTRFYADVTLDQDGTWAWRLASKGAVETAEEGYWYVRVSLVLP